MNLEGSCHCSKIKFRAISNTPYPYMRCYCSICRKCNGSGGYGINIMARKDDGFKITQGEDLIRRYASSQRTERAFCSECGSHLWCYSEEWPQWIYPYASAIDTELPAPPHVVHLLLDSRCAWCPVQKVSSEKDTTFEKYPELGIEEWHKKHGLWIEDK